MVGLVDTGMGPPFRGCTFPEVELSTDVNVEFVISVTNEGVNVL